MSSNTYVGKAGIHRKGDASNTGIHRPVYHAICCSRNYPAITRRVWTISTVVFDCRMGDNDGTDR